MSKRVAGKRILVTGGASGLGACFVERLANEGAIIAIADINSELGNELAKKIGGLFIRLDVSKEADWQNCAKAIENQFGGLDGLVNNAAIAGSKAKYDIENIDIEDFRKMYDINVNGTVLGCKTCIPLMAKSGGGSIVNMSSIAALIPTDFLISYGSSKAAIVHLTQSIALHCAKSGYNIRANSVHPGNILTPMMQGLIEHFAKEAGITEPDMAAYFLSKIPLGKWQEPEDIAHAVLYLQSDEARFITGTKIIIDGGMTLSN